LALEAALIPAALAPTTTIRSATPITALENAAAPQTNRT